MYHHTCSGEVVDKTAVVPLGGSMVGPMRISGGASNMMITSLEPLGKLKEVEDGQRL